MKRPLSSLLLAVLAGIAPAVALGEDPPVVPPEPVLVAAFSGVEDAVQDAEFLGGLAGNDGLPEVARGLLRRLTGGKALQGLDSAKPWALIVPAEAGKYPVLLFVPTTDLETLLASLRPALGEPTDLGDGLRKLAPKGLPPVFVRRNEAGWAVASPSREALGAAPADPVPLLGDLPDHYRLAARFSMSHVPTADRLMVLAEISAGLEAGLQRLPAETDQEHGLRAELAHDAYQRLADLVEQLDSVTIGLAVDRQAESVRLDGTVSGVADSELAARLGALRPFRSDLAGFSPPNCGMKLNFGGRLSDRHAESLGRWVADFRSQALAALADKELPADQSREARQIVEDLTGSLARTIEDRQVDVAVSAILGQNMVTALAAMKTAEPERLQRAANLLIQKVLEDQAGLAGMMQLDADQQNDVHLHTLSLALDPIETDEIYRRVLGGKLDVAWGIDDHTVYVAVGRNALWALKQAIQASADHGMEELPAFRLSLAAMPAARASLTLQNAQRNRAISTLIRGLGRAQSEDSLVITAAPVSHGLRVRAEAQRDVLGMIGPLAEMLENALPAGGPEP